MQSNAYGNEILIFLLILVVVVIVLYLISRFRKTPKQSDHYLDALEHLADGDNKNAIQQFKEAVKADSSNIRAYLRLGNLLREKGMLKNALKIHKDLTLRENVPGKLKKQIEQNLMLDYELSGDFGNAAKIAQEIVARSRSDQVVEKLLFYLEQQGLWEQAYSVAKSNLKIMGDKIRQKTALYLVFWGLEFIKEDRGKDARIKFKEALKIDKNCFAALYYLGHSYNLEHRVEEAIQQWKKLASSDSEIGSIVYRDLERSWFELGKFSEAIKLYRELISKNEKNVAAANALCEIYNKKGEYDSALEVLNQIEMDDRALCALRAKILMNKGMYKNAAAESVEYLEKVTPKPLDEFKCKNCNYIAKEVRWYCPKCKSISSFV